MNAAAIRPAAVVTPVGRWPLILLATLVLMAVVLFWPSISALAELWSNPDRRTYQHGYVIAAISLWLVFRRRDRIAAAAGNPSPALLLLAGVLGLAWAVALNAGLQIAHFVLWPAVLLAAVAGMLGARSGRLLLLPVGYLYFAMPIWDVLTKGLQVVTVFANEIFAALAGVPVLIEDVKIHIPEGSFEIAGGCSGLNYFIVGLAISTLLGELNRDNRDRRVLLMVIGGALAIFSNWVRVFAIIYAGHVSNMTHYLVRVDHYNFGWVLYAFMLIVFFMVVRRLPVASAAPDVGPAPAGPWAPRAVPVAASILALAIGPLVANGNALSVPAIRTSSPATGIHVLDLNGSSQWQAEPVTEGWIPVFPGADAESFVEFSRGRDRVTVYTATYLRQGQGHELIGHDSRIQGSAEGQWASQRRAEAAPSIAVIDSEWRSAVEGNAVFWWTYQIGSHRFTSELPAQLWYGFTSLWSAPVSSIVVLRVECRPDCDEARQVLASFASEALPELLSTSGGPGTSNSE